MVEKNTYKGAPQFSFIYCFRAMDVTAIPTRHAERNVRIIHNTYFLEAEGWKGRAESSTNIKFYFFFLLANRSPKWLCRVLSFFLYGSLNSRITFTSNEWTVMHYNTNNSVVVFNHKIRIWKLTDGAQKFAEISQVLIKYFTSYNKTN